MGLVESTLRGSQVANQQAELGRDEIRTGAEGVGLEAEASRVYRGRTQDRFLAVNGRKRGVETDLLANHPGKHVIFVRYTGTHSPHEEWIYNLADIDTQPVVWAQDMGWENSKLVAYYPDRSFWMFEPDVDPGYLQPYKNP